MRAEQGIIAFLRGLKTREPTASSTPVGIGDDAAVLRVPKGHDLLVTTDLFVEGVHFLRGGRGKLSGAAAGRRALGRALSDLAAMGGEPHWAFLSLALPKGFPAAWLRDFLRAFVAAAGSYGVKLAGGDTGSSGSAAFLVDVVVCGSAPRGAAVLRSGAKPGDVLFVSGRLGATAAALAARRSLPPTRPRLRLGQHLRRQRLAAAMIDISDGLSTDLSHLTEESRVGAEIEVRRLPRSGTLEQALHGGEDYELLFAVRPGRAALVRPKLAGINLTRIGRVVRGKGLILVYPDGSRKSLQPGGWEHFRPSRP